MSKFEQKKCLIQNKKQVMIEVQKQRQTINKDNNDEEELPRPSLSNIQPHNSHNSHTPIKYRPQRVVSRSSHKKRLNQDNWDNYVLDRLANQLHLKGSGSNLKVIQYQGDRLARSIKPKTFDKIKPKAKGLQKFKAYSAKMKIPSYQDIRKVPIESIHKNKWINNNLQWVQDICHPKLDMAQLKTLNYQKSEEDNPYKRDIKSSLQSRKPVIRRRSINPKKKVEETYISRKIESTYSYVAASPKAAKKINVIHKNSDSSCLEKNQNKSKCEERYPNNTSIKPSPKKDNKSFHDSVHERSFRIESRKQRTSVSQDKSQIDSPLYLQMGISFKRKEGEKSQNNSLVKYIETIIPEQTNREGTTQVLGAGTKRDEENENEDQQKAKMTLSLNILQENTIQIEPHPPLPFNSQQQQKIQPESQSNRSITNQKVVKYNSTAKLNRDNSQSLSSSPSKQIKQLISRQTFKYKNIDDKKACLPIEKFSKGYQSGKMLIFNSEDKYIRKVLVREGWVVNPDLRSKYFTLKWIFKPILEDYNNLAELQFVNHIKNSHQLTSKNYLNKNLRNNQVQWPQLYRHYPRCYDLSKLSQKNQFKQQYTKQFMMILLRRIYNYLRCNSCQEVKRAVIKYQNLLEQDGSYCTDTKYISAFRKRQFRSIDLQNYKYHDENFTLHGNLLVIALRYWRSIRKREELQFQDNYHFLNFQPKEFDHNLQNLQQYSQQSPSHDESVLDQYFIKNYYSTPSSIAIERVVKEYVYFERSLGEEWQIYGDRNVWIVKPCSASRGNGIYLDNNSREILLNSKGIQTRIVQKYIQRPLLFKQGGFISGKKFDLRQWVLLRSVNPLQIYMFSHCYVRICSDEYQITNISNLKSHLTNYSFNKTNFKSKDESVLDYDRFIELIESECGVNFETQIRPKIKEIIINSIKSAQENLQDMNRRCFSLLGYDILIDEKCNPWLLEVNMSPACEERTQWLKEYLMAMGQGMLKIILPKQLSQTIQTPALIDPLSTQYIRNSRLMSQQKPRNKGKGRCSSRQSQQMQRIKTDMSQQFLPFQSQKCGSVFQAGMQNGVRQEVVIDRGLQLSESYEQIDYDKFVMEHQPSTSDAFNNEYLQLPTKQNQDPSVLANEVPEGENKEQEVAEKHELQLYKTKDAVDQLKSMQNILVSRKELAWELICLEEYPTFTKKQPENLDVIAVKISSQNIKSNDVRIDQYEQTKDEVYNSVLKLQRRIKQFLAKKKASQIDKKNRLDLERQKFSRINFSRIGRNQSQRYSRSAFFQDESIWHYNYMHTYRQCNIEKKQIERISASELYCYGKPKSKRDKNHSKDGRVRSKIRSELISSAVGIEHDLEEILFEQREESN